MRSICCPQKKSTLIRLVIFHIWLDKCVFFLSCPLWLHWNRSTLHAMSICFCCFFHIILLGCMTNPGRLKWFIYEYFWYSSGGTYLLDCLHLSPNIMIPLKRRHNGRYGVSNHQPRDCLLNRSFRRRSKKMSKLCVTGLCWWPVNSPENVSIW